MQKVYLEYNFGYIEHVRNITVVMPNITSVIFQIWLSHITTSYSSRLWQYVKYSLTFNANPISSVFIVTFQVICDK
jgi:hypothetical protein